MTVIGNVLEELAKIALIPLQLTAAASATNVAIHKIFFWIWRDCINHFLAKQLKIKQKNRKEYF